MPPSEAEIDRLIAGAPIARLATIARDGRPHIVPIVFVEASGSIYSPIDGKPKRTVDLARLRNVAANGTVSVLIDHYEGDWRALWWIRIDGIAEVVTESDMPADGFAFVVNALRRKYPQYATVPVFQGTPTLLRIQPRRRSTWFAAPNPSDL